MPRERHSDRNEKPRQGHNGEDVNSADLKRYIERIENVDDEISELKKDRGEIFAEAKGSGYDTKIMRRVLAIRKQDAEERRETEQILELYCNALGIRL